MIVNCRRFTELLTDAADQRIASWEEPHFVEHGHVCGPCRRYARDFERVVALLHDLPKETAPEAMRSALLAKFRSVSGQEE